MTLHSEQDAIKQAVEAGWTPEWMMPPLPSIPRRIQIVWGWGVAHGISSYLLDPASWQALGKARGWEEHVAYMKLLDTRFPADLTPTDMPEWKLRALRYFETVLSGGDTKAFWESLP